MSELDDLGPSQLRAELRSLRDEVNKYEMTLRKIDELLLARLGKNAAGLDVFDRLRAVISLSEKHIYNNGSFDELG